MSKVRQDTIIAPLEDGSAIVRVRIPVALMSISRQMAQRWQLDPVQALRVVLDQVAASIDKTMGDVLGPAFSSGYEQMIVENKAPTNGISPADLSKLHRSPRANSASGFTGVYRNGKNWRAQARDPNGGSPITVGTFITAERAAMARYLHYQQHGLPYGDIENELDDPGGDCAYYREKLEQIFGRKPTDAEVVAEVNQTRREIGRPEIPWEGELPEPGFVAHQMSQEEILRLRETVK